MTSPAPATAPTTAAAALAASAKDQADAKAGAAVSAGGRTIQLIKTCGHKGYDFKGISGIGRALTNSDIGNYMVRVAPTESRWPAFGFIPTFMGEDGSLVKVTDDDFRYRMLKIVKLLNDSVTCQTVTGFSMDLKRHFLDDNWIEWDRFDDAVARNFAAAVKNPKVVDPGCKTCHREERDEM